MAQLEALGKRYESAEEIEDFRTARIVAMLANVNRDTKKRRQPYTPQDFMMTRQAKVMPDEDMLAQKVNAAMMAFGGLMAG